MGTDTLSRPLRYHAFLYWLAVAFAALAFLLVAYHRAPVILDGSTSIYPYWGPDSFFHAARVLDTASNPLDFYEYDVQSDTRISWPWGYDLIIGSLLFVLTKLVSGIPAGHLLPHLPAIFGALNCFLLAGLLRLLRFNPLSSLFAVAFYAVWPLTTYLHAIGRIDHHMAEHTVLLLFLLVFVRWFSDGENSKKAIVAGCVTGAGLLVHNGLFLLHLPVSLTLLLFWRNRQMPGTTRQFALAQFCVTLLLVLASSYFWQLEYNYALLSWFHLHVSLAVLSCVAFMCWKAFSPRHFGILVCLAVFLAAPMLWQVSQGLEFLQVNLPYIDLTSESRHIFSQPDRMLKLYSPLLYAMPFLLAGFLTVVARDRRPELAFLAVTTLAGLLFMLVQFRFFQYGYVFLLLCLLFCTRLETSLLPGQYKFSSAAIVLFVLVLAASGFVQIQVAKFPPGGERAYIHYYPYLKMLGRECEKDPGEVLAFPGAGHWIRLHTACSLSVNMMVQVEHDIRKLERFDHDLDLPVKEFLKKNPDIKYILLNRDPSREGLSLVQEMQRHDRFRQDLFFAYPSVADYFQGLGFLYYPGERNDGIPVIMLLKVKQR